MMRATGMQPATVRPQTETAAPDRLTLAAVAVVAYSLGTMLHEAVGHGGACLISGGTPIVVSTVHMECSADTRLVMAGGTLVNLASAAVFFALLRAARRGSLLQYFAWLSMTIHLMVSAGYFLFSGVGGFGDWAMFIRGLGPEWLLRIVLAVFGAAAYVAVTRFCAREMRPLVGSGERRARRAAELMRTPYFTGGALHCISGALNPVGMYLVALSAAAATFGGTSGLMWMHNWLKGADLAEPDEGEAAAIGRSWAWIAAGAVVAVVFIVVLGPGVRFR